MLTVDLLHEVELGVWKALLTHLIRMLNACGVDKVHKFDERYGLLKIILQQPTYLGPVFEWFPHLVTTYVALRGTFLI